MTGSAPQSSEQDINSHVARLREEDAQFAHWTKGYGVIVHDETTQARIHGLATRLQELGVVPSTGQVFRVLAAADRVASAAMWLVVHLTYARAVHLDGRELEAADFKTAPEGHTGGSLNMVPAYVGYLAANTLSGLTRSWVMGQGHCVSAIESVNLLVGNMTPAHAERYGITAEGLGRFVQDFYAYTVRPDGRPASPLGSHVNPHTAGGVMEGGYLGFAELQYMHMPLPGERLVAFLSDGAFEEQRGSDWAPRWWRAADCGLLAPFMIMNGRRIDQRSSMAMKGGFDWLQAHLEHNGFAPFDIDGQDPASYAWGILECEQRLEESIAALEAGETTYPVPLPYGIATCVKGYGFPGAGSNRAHNLPLQGNPAQDSEARAEFNVGAHRLWVEYRELTDAVRMLNRHSVQDRPKERDHPLAHREIARPQLPEPPWRDPGRDEPVGAMQGIDAYFCDILAANPQLRPRVGNPDEIHSNRLDRTLETLRHRVADPEAEVPEAVHGHVITALNEEAVVSAALANKGGINLVASYEAFAVKMLGAIRQELIFARHQAASGRPPGWLSVPVIATSHTWENGKNEQSHQDPTLCEALLGEMNDVSRVLFPGDWNSALAALRAVYASHGQMVTLVVPKRPLPVRFTAGQAQTLIEQGAVRLYGSGDETERLLLCATGGYQLAEALRASARLQRHGVGHAVVYLQEPGRFRIPRDERELACLTSKAWVDDLFPPSAEVRVFLTHTRPEPFIGMVWPLLTNMALTPVLGYINHGGTLDVDGMLFANRCTWAHVVAAAAVGFGREPSEWLTQNETAALAGKGDPAVLFGPAS
jgi:phosphoketolase